MAAAASTISETVKEAASKASETPDSHSWERTSSASRRRSGYGVAEEKVAGASLVSAAEGPPAAMKLLPRCAPAEGR